MPVKYENYEHTIKLPGSRVAFVPTTKCREYGKHIVSEIKKVWKPHEIYTHFQSGGHVSALHKHRENKLFAILDITKFFYSISRNHVCKSIKKRKISKSRDLAKYSSVKNPFADDGLPKYALPYGFVQSPL